MKKKKENTSSRSLKNETKQGMIAIVFFAVAALLVLASIGRAGFVGGSTYRGLSYLLGFGYFLLPAVFLMLGASFWKSIKKSFPTIKVIGALIFFLSGLALMDLFARGTGGAAGGAVLSLFLAPFDVYASAVILGTCLLIAVIVIFEPELTLHPIAETWRRLFAGRGGRKPALANREDSGEEAAQEEPEEEPGSAIAPPLPPEKKTKAERAPAIARSDEDGEEMDRGESGQIEFKRMGKVYVPPPLSLLEHDKGKPVVGDIKANANIIKRTLQNFGINVEMDEVSIGPSITRYALKPAEGVKLSRIVALQNDLSLALAAHPLRIEAPIPGKSLVGIEIPNSTRSTVGLATLLASDEYERSDKPLLVSLGKGISGKSHFANLAKMPHLLIAGATGSGKSVAIHTIITSLLFRNSVENLKFILIDPKRVELTLYNKIPHLLTPVITEAKKAILALKWAAKEMDRRYDILESESVRDIESYHKNVLEPALRRAGPPGGKPEENAALPELMPYIVIVIDELADIMSTYPRELEAAIVRLAQMSRATGIHLILSTQRPSVNVITGLIKANVPGRIALQVASQIDSRTILDTSGAEKLLGAGDMLFLGSEMSKPQRLQSAYISEQEVKKVVKYLRDQYGEELESQLTLTNESAEGKNPVFDSGLEDGEEIGDDLYEAAREEVLKVGKASTSYIQRKLRVGYARAARLIDMLEERGVIGPADGSKPREVVGAREGSGEETDAEGSPAA